MTDSIRKCYLCGVVLQEFNNSKEHLIPHAIGGRKKISGFICRTCNSTTGQKWDAALAEELNWFSLYLGIVRESGTPPSMKIDSDVGRLWLHHDGSQSLDRPKYEISQEGESAILNIRARTTKEAYQLLERAKSQYPGLDIEEVKKSVSVTNDHSPRIFSVSLEFGGEKTGRSLVKSCLALACEAGISVEQCSNAIAYLTGDGEPSFGYVYDRDLVRHRPPESIFHCVAISGNSESRMLLGYVEYFSLHRMVVCLSEDYEGASFEHSYAIDPRVGRQIDIKVDLPFTKTDVRSIYDYEMFSDEGRFAAMNALMAVAYKASEERALMRAIDEAYLLALKECGLKAGDPMDRDMAFKLSTLITENIMPFIRAKIDNGRPPQE